MVNQVETLLLALKQAGVELWVEEGRLRSRAPEGAITPELREGIKARRDEIIALFLNVQNTQSSPFGKKIPKVAQQANYAMSNAQRRLWILNQMSDTLEAKTAYNIPAAVRMRGDLNIGALTKALHLLTQRHESLRTRFMAIEGEGRQIIDQIDGHFNLELQEFSENDRISEAIQAHAGKIFDLENEHLFSVKLLKISAAEHLLLLNMHHIISDGWSISVLMKELSQLYEACVDDHIQPLSLLPELTIQYKDYAAWQNSLMEDEAIVGGLRNFWLETLKNAPSFDLPTDFARPAVKSYKGAAANRQFSNRTAKALQSLTERNGATLFMTLTALVKTLIYRYTRQSDLVIGSPNAGRPHPDLHPQIGFYINTLTLRSKIDGTAPFEVFLQQVRKTALSAFEHELYPFDRLVEDLDIPRDMSRAPLFDVMLVVQNNESTSLRLGNLELELEALETNSGKFDLSFVFDENSDGLFLHVEYNTDIFKKDRIERLFDHLETLVDSVSAHPHFAVDQLNILPETEKQRLLEAFNVGIGANTNTKSNTNPDLADQTLVQLFEAQVNRTPDEIALVFGNKTLSYRALNETANQLAHFLRANHAVQPDDIIALQLERSEQMIVAILGVLKSGAAYLPIATDAPPARATFMLQDSRTKALLTDDSTHSSALHFQTTLAGLEIVNITTEFAQNQPVVNPDSINKPQDLAYIIYTSGSTGQPKGVMVEHAGVVNLAQWQIDYFGLQTSDAVLQFAAYTFDASVWEIMSTLLSGARLALFGEASKSPEQILELISAQKISWMTLPPVFLSSLDKKALVQMDHLKGIITAGDKPVLEDVKALNKHLRYINAYGPTEYSVCISAYDIPKDWNESYVPVGKPIRGTEVFILDERLDLCPIGIPGELCVSGAGIARGYLNRPELSAEKFIAHPFNPGERLYKTGDLARWMPDGNIEFLGRIDQQLKIRGFRIEAGEIEQALLGHPSVQSCVVVGHAFEQGKELVAYLVLQTIDSQPDTAELRSFLALRLPDYMIPAYFVELDTLPLTSTGKVDRKALPAPAQGNLSLGTLYVAPRNEREQLLADIWEQVLRRTGIGIHDNFFHAGGDSIKAIQISSRLGAAGWQLAMKELFAHPTIAGQANRMERKKRKYDQGLITGAVPLTAVQQWFFDDFTVDQHHFNQAVMLEWPMQIDLDILRVVLNALLQQHDMLRAVYVASENGPLQTIGENLQADLQLFFLPTGEAAQQLLLQKANEVQSSFDLQTGPLFKAVMFRDEQGIDPDRLLLVIHHLVVDGISWRILMEDLEIAYKQVLAGEKLKLTEKTASFQLWANTLSDYVAQQFPEQQIAYWKSVSEASSVLPGFLPDHPEAENRMSDTRALSFLLSEAETSALLHQVNQAYHTEINDLLLTALSRALHASCGAQAYSITLEGHGREQIVDLDISRTVGWFTSAFPFILSHHSDGGRHLQEVKEALRKVPNKGLGFGLLRYFAGIESMQGASQISFNYLGSFDQFGDNSDSLFGFSSAGTGDSSSARASRLHELEVSGVLIGGQLRISISYSDKRMETARMEALVAEYHTALRYLIEHCVSVENGRLSPADFSGCNMDMAEYDQFLAHHQIEASFIEDIYPLSPLQEGMLFEWMLHPDSPAYFTQLEINLGNRVDAVLLKNAWQQLIKRHAILRTAFFNEYTGAEQRPLQVVFKEMPISFEEIDLRSLNEQAQENAIAAYRAQDQKRGFELSALPLIRFALFQRSEERSTMLMSNHHIIMDGWSLGILFKEMLLLYTHGNTANLPAPILYSSHIRYLEAQNSDKASQFWQEYLHEYEPAALIPDLKVAGKLNVMIPREHLFHLSEVETTALSQLAARAQASLNTVLQGLWAVLLGRYNQRRDIVFGMTTSGRTAENEGTEDIVGLFINTIPVRIRWEEGWGFIELVQALQLNAQKAQEYAHYALVQIQALTGEKGGSDLFDHLMVFENYPIDETLTKGGADSGLLIESVRGYDPVHYDMNLTVSPGKKLGFKIGWNESAWPEAWVNIVEGHLRRLIGSILAAPNQQISTLEIVPEQERNIVLYDFNDTAAGYPKDKTIVQLFEEQAEKTPDQTALIFGETTFTYRELNEKANQLAHYLRNTHQIQANDVVALQIERSASTIIGILGVLKSGAAYLPISTEFPPARVRYMLANSRAKTLLTDEISHVSALEFKAELPDLSIERLDRILSKDLPAHNPERINAGPDLAYVLYTSGSTGQPKGVSMPQRSLVNMIQWQNAHCNLGHGDRTAQFVPYTFDVSFQEIFATLSSGGTLIVLPQDIQQQFTELPHFIAKHRINRLFLPFVGLQQLAELVKDAPTQLSDLKEIITAGEQLQSSAAIRHLLASLPGCVLKNQYGPTEAHVVSEYVLGSYPAAWPDLPPIGKPIANVELHILDAHFQPTPIGIPGELLIGGIALADGYLNNADLTAEKFIAHPFKSGARLYKTGDLARWLPDGNIEYLGRIDQQLKIRGYRIETGEIEQVLLSHEGVQTCVVVGLEFSGVKELAAYLVPKPETSLPDATILRSFLGNTLPDYMIPSYFVALESMPMTSSGKVDRKALPAPDMAQLASGAAYVAPRNAIENQLVEIWQQVLGRDQIGVEDNFFNLGGHSLRAIRVVSLIRQALSVEIRLSEIFANPTIAALAERVIAESKVNFKTLESIPQLAPSADYALSNAQRRLWVLDQMSETAEAHAAYNMPAALRLRGDLDVVALEQVFELLFERHESLRTKFRDGRQVISPVAPYQLPQRDCQGMSAAAIDILVKTHALRAFDLANDSLLQLELLQLEADEYLLLFNMHHIISDGWSLDVLVREMTTLYEAIHQGVKEPLSALPALKIQYKDYAAWQNELLESESAEVMRTFWLNQLSKEDGMLPTLELPTDYARPTLKTYNGATIGTVLPAKVLDGLKTLCQTQGATLFMGLTALVKSLIYRYTGQEDILIGTPVAGRNHPDLHDQIGFYINTVVLRNRLQGDESFETLLNAVKTSTLAAFEHEAYPFDRLVEDLDLPRDLSRSTVFDVMLVLQNNERSELRFGDVALSVEGAETGISKFDLTFSFTETAEGLLMGLEYNTDLFKSDRIARMAEHLQTLLDSVLYDPKAAIGALNLLPAAEKQQLLYNFNDTSADYPKDKTIVQLFEKQVEKTPDQTAVVFEGRALSYRELNEQSNQLAHHLRGTYNIKPDDIVALQLGRSERMIIAIMGVLKSGAAYLPIALDYPEMRVTYMLKDSGAKVLLTDAVVHESALNLKADLPDLVIEPIEQAMAGSGETDNPACNNHGSSLAYVIYTSGSTGLPKGVMVEHHNFLNFAGHYPFEQHVCSLTCNYIFDVSVMEMLPALLASGTLVIPPLEVTLDLDAYAEFLYRNKITNTYLHASYLEGISARLAQYPEVYLKRLQIGVEPIRDHSIAWYKAQNIKILNWYGPTETTIFSTVYEVPNETPVTDEKLLIGQPIHNTAVLILDSSGALQPIGVSGELCIAGAGLARGYLNNPTLTAEKFVPHPFKVGERMYKTGDLARWLPDGDIEFLGRIDYQLKIRGYRIEAGEIEQALLKHEAIKSCLVTGYERDGVKELVAYLVPVKVGTVPDTTMLRRFLSATLPEYMIPGYYVELEAFPLTPSGKINRKALPTPDAGVLVVETSYTAPRNAVEGQLVEIWQQVLGREQIGVEDNFFNLGGHSLRAIRVVSLIRQAMSVEIRLSEIFANPTIAALAERVITESKDNLKTLQSIPQLAESADYALSNAQRRLWVIDQMSETAEAHAAYNMPATLRLRGDLDIAALERVFELLFERHESLRTLFRDGRQVIVPATPYQLPQRDCRGMGAEAIDALVEAHALRAFDLALDSLLQLELLQLEADAYLLLFNMHHIISDGWSMEVLVREMTKLYEAIQQGVEHPLSVLPTLKIQYKDYAAWQNGILESDEVEVMRTFWLNQLSKEDGMIPTLELPTDYARPTLKTYNGATISTVLPAKVLDGLKTLCQTQGATLFMGLTALVNGLFYRYTGQEDILIGTPVAGRIHPDLYDQIGFYVNTVVLRNRLRGEESFKTLLNAVKINTLSAFEHEAYPFDRLVEDLDLPRDLSRSAVFDVLLVLQNNEQSELRFGDVALSVEGAETVVSKFDLTFNFAETADGLLMGLEYNTDLFKSDRITRLAEHLLTLMNSALLDPASPIEGLNLLPEQEREQVLLDFNNTATDYPSDKTIVQLFEEQVAKTPDQTALVFGTRTLSYRELNEQSNQLANYLRDIHNIQSGDIVALQLERSEWMIISIMAVLKSGAAYLPISTDAPPVRATFMLQDSRAKVLLTDDSTHSSGLHFQTALPGLEIVNITTGFAQNQPLANPNSINKPHDLAYIIYTSGSTGQPKGVMVEHAGVVNLALWQIDYFGLQTGDAVLQFAAYTFDASVWEIMSTLLSGARLALFGEASKSPEQILELISAQKISWMTLPPVFLSSLDKKALAQMDHLKGIITAGDKPVLDDVKALNKYLRYINAYGPTEYSVCISAFEVPKDWNESYMPVGKPIRDTEVFILDERLGLCPIGIPGELCVSGAGIARGYLNRSELSAEKFVAHPFKPGERMYKTGDLARWMPDGNIEFLGRIDHQLKIRGYRVEAGEIEQALLEHPAVQSCVAVGHAFEKGKELVAYLVPKPETTLPDATNLRSFLSNTLPDYMIPSYFVALESLPMTSSGKVDRKALPAPDMTQLASDTVYVAPRNAIENQLVEIWQQVLGRDQIGVEDNFFSLGGHSLRAIRLSAEISKLTGKNIPLRMIFQHPTIAELSAKISSFKDVFHAEGICYNPDAAKMLFAFPPFAGLAVFYEEMAALTPAYAWYCFDFLESEHRLEHYYDQIKRQQPEGPYCMFGYSVGGALAYEVARYLESKGETVSGVIFGDAAFLLETHDFDLRTHLNLGAKDPDMQQLMHLLEDPAFYKRTESRLTKYHQFLSHLQLSKPIRANIHQIAAQRSIEINADDPKRSLDWSAQTTGSFFVYPAVGEHSVMFDAQHIEFNVLQLKFILAQIHQPQDELTIFPDADFLGQNDDAAGHSNEILTADEQKQTHLAADPALAPPQTYAPEQLKYVGFVGDEFSEPIPEEMLSLEDLIEQHKALHTEMLRLLQQKNLMTQA